MVDNQVVPFGKYKDQPVEALMQDDRYREWLVAQDWFRSRYASLFQIVLNGGGEPQDSPEHNAMQAQFLDSSWMTKIGKIVKERLCPCHNASYFSGQEIVRAEFLKESLKGSSSTPSFEDRGWDVSCGLRIEGKLDVWLAQKRGPLLDEKGEEEAPVVRERQWFETHETALLELKPTLSDDYPTVLREMKARHRDDDDYLFLIVREASFQHVSWEQVKAIFETADITALLESEIAP